MISIIEVMVAIIIKEIKMDEKLAFSSLDASLLVHFPCFNYSHKNQNNNSISSQYGSKKVKLWIVFKQLSGP